MLGMGPEVDAAMYPCSAGEARKPGSLDGFLDHIFEPVLSGGFSVSRLPSRSFALVLGRGHPFCFSRALALTLNVSPFRIWNKAGP